MNTTFHSSNLNSESDFYSIKLPEYRKAKLELWKFLNLNELKALLGCFESQEHGQKTEYKRFKALLTQQLQLNEADKKDQILMDKYYYLVKYGLANGFNQEQISCLLSIIKRTHELAVETSFGNLDETYDYFKSLLLVNAVHRPPYSLHLFNIKQVEQISEYMFDTYFKLFKCYKYVFSSAVRLDLKFKYSHLPHGAGDDLVEVSQVGSKEFMSEDLCTSAPAQSGDEAKSDTQAAHQEQAELKEFIRNYLGDKLNKMKQELAEELSMSSRKTPSTDRAAKKSPAKSRR